MSRTAAHACISSYASALAIFLGASGAQAASQLCGPLKEFASLEMTMLPDGSRVAVPLTINGMPVPLLVDTGAGMSSLTQPAAAMLGVRQRNSAKTRLVNASGTAIHRYYLADKFQLGHLSVKDVPFMQDVDADDARVSGVLGPDLMVRYDVEMDFSGQRLNYFSQDHCPGHIVHWPADAVAEVPISIVARAKDYPPPLFSGAVGGLSPDFVAMVEGMARRAPILGTDIRTKVVLDGRLFAANIDTGLDTSTINSKAAQDYFDVPWDSKASEPEAHQDQSSQPRFGTENVTVTGWRRQHQFHTLIFGGIKVVNPLFVLKPGPLGARRVGDPQSPDITIGMNVLRKLHLYFAFGERVLYASAAVDEMHPGGEK